MGGRAGAGNQGAGGAGGRRGPCGKTCAELGAECGDVFVDGCLLVTECGDCPEPRMCGFDGSPGRCGSMGRWQVAMKGGTDLVSQLFNVHQMWGTAADDIWAVNRYGEVLHYDGQSWETAVRIGTPLYGIHGTSSLNLWVVGDDGTVLRREGDEFRALPKPSSYDLNAIWVAGRDEAWVVAVDGLYHWQGGKWIDADEVSERGFLTVWGADNGDVWAAGRDGRLSRRTGGAWKALATNGTSTIYNQLWGSGPNDIWAAGSHIAHWDGKVWEIVTDPPRVLFAVFGVSPTDLWFAGLGGLLIHSDSRNFQVVRSPTTEPILTLWGSGNKNVWAGGSGGLILHYSGDGVMAQ